MSQDNQKQRILALKQKRNGVEQTINALRGANPRLQTGIDTIETIYQNYKDIIKEYAKKDALIPLIIQKKENLIDLNDQEINQLTSFIDFCLLSIAEEIQKEIDNLLKEEGSEEEKEEELKTEEETKEKKTEKEDEDIAREAAQFVLLNENPDQTPEEISEEVEKLASVFSEYYRDEYDKNPNGIAKVLQKSVQERYGSIAEKEFVSYFDQIINLSSNVSEESKIALLQEFMRQDIQVNLLKILEDRLLLEKIFFHPTDIAFQEFINSPFFTYIYESLKKEVVQHNRSGFARIFNSISPISNFKYGYNTNENNHALVFVTTADRLNILRNNPDLYNRFVQSVSSFQNTFIPQNGQEAFLGLLVASVDPQEKESFYKKLYTLMISSGFQKEQHPYHNLFLFLEKIKPEDKNNPSFSWLLLFKAYALGFGKDILRMYDFFSSTTGSMGYKLSGGGSFIPRTFGFVGGKLIGGAGGKLTESLLKRFAPSVLGGPVGIALAAGLGVLKKMSSYFFQDVPFLKDVSQSLSLEKIIIYSVVSIFLVFIVFLSPSNPIQIQQKIMPEYVDKNNLTSTSVNIPTIDCQNDPSNPICTICSDSNGQRDPNKCLWPVASGCITQGPNLNHATEPGGQGIDIGRANGLPVRASFPGEVIEARWEFVDNQTTKRPNFGNMVRIRTTTNPPFTIVYAHLRQTNTVNVGDVVSPDTIIGYVDHTGYSSGPHLHIEIHGVPAGNVLPFDVPPCNNQEDCDQQISLMGYSACW